MSKQILVPFAPDMKKAILEGRKICTTRSEAKGRVKDWFLLDGRKFKFVAVFSIRLGNVTRFLFRAEGVVTSGDFIRLWRSLHRGHYNPEAYKFVHFFKEVIG